MSGVDGMSISERDLAVEIVDGMFGYTAEFSPSPDWHREQYDRAEEIIARALNTPGAVEDRMMLVAGLAAAARELERIGQMRAAEAARTILSAHGGQ